MGVQHCLMQSERQFWMWDIDFRKLVENQRPSKVIFVITTDGMENASREFSYEKVKELINISKKNMVGSLFLWGQILMQ